MGRGGCCGFIATIFFCALMAALHDVGIILFKTPLAATQHTWAGTRKILCTTVSLPSIDDKAREKIVFNILRQWDKELAICKEAFTTTQVRVAGHPELDYETTEVLQTTSWDWSTDRRQLNSMAITMSSDLERGVAEFNKYLASKMFQDAVMAQNSAASAAVRNFVPVNGQKGRVYKGAYSVFIADNEDERIWDRSLMVIWNLILFIVTVRFALA